MTHTPGPWFVTNDMHGKASAVVTSLHKHDDDGDGLDDDVCEVYGGNDDHDDVREANARLIAAAPDLLDAVRTLLACLSDLEQGEQEWHHYKRDMEEAAEVVAKAKGRRCFKSPPLYPQR